MKVDGPCLYVGWDRLGLMTYRGDITRDLPLLMGLPLAAVWAVQAGVVHGPVPPTPTIPSHLYGDTAVQVPVLEGPAVWIRCSAFEWLLPNPDPQRLGAEIQHRRRRVAAYGGFAAQECYEADPKLRPGRGPHGPILPALPPEIPPHPACLEPGQFVPLPELSLPPLDGPARHPVPRPVPPGERATRVTLTLPGTRPAGQSWAESPSEGVAVEVDREIRFESSRLHWTEWFRDARSSRRSVAAFRTAGLLVVRAGVLRGVPADTEIVLEGTHREPFRIHVGDGPVVWLWGPEVELVLATPDAPGVAAEINVARWEIARDPSWRDRPSWRDHPPTAPVATPSGPAPAPPPPYAPHAPTMVPPDCWTPTD